MKVVAFVGTQSSGKSTAASALIQHGYLPFSFADAMKDALATIFCWRRDFLEGISQESRQWREQIDPWWAERLGIPEFSPRYAMRNFGSLMRTYFHPEVWVLNIERRLAALRDAFTVAHNVVLIDVRYPNEIALVRRLGGHLERIKRGEDPWWLDTARMIFAEPDPTKRQSMIDNLQTLVHDSEWAWLECDVDGITTNDATISDLRAKVVAKFV